ncbi:MAG: hypothetical protein FJ225_08570 [Lentisphaerae bacterium]|nr:hypothetical protein [Lentisphaerota bacterium]
MKNRQKAQMRLLATAVAGLLVAGLAAAGEHPEQPGKQAEEKAPAAAVALQEACPVTGGKIDKASYVDHDGKRIYMCCPGCAGALKADPVKYIKKLESEGIALDPAGKSGEQK